MATATSTRVLTTSLRGSWVRDLALVVAGAAFIAVSAQVSIPLPFSPVPVTGQTFAVLLTGAALGASLGVAATGLYLAAALAGLPVLAPTETGGHLTGSAVLTMPTLGYVVGFMAASAAVGTLAARGLTRSPLGTVAAMLVGNVVIYGLGLIWLRHALSASWSDAIAWGLTPFLVGDAVKIALAVGVLPAAWSFVRD
jgi:biotin transport system substrate-specific component